MVLNLSIGQGENSQTVANMARFYTALATDGSLVRPEIVRRQTERTKIVQSDAGADGRTSARDGRRRVGARNGGGRADPGRTDRREDGNGADMFRNGIELNHAWFVGYAPADDPKIVVAVMLEFVRSTARVAARVASKMIERYLKRPTIQGAQLEGD